MSDLVEKVARAICEFGTPYSRLTPLVQSLSNDIARAAIIAVYDDLSSVDTVKEMSFDQREALFSVLAAKRKEVLGDG